MSEHSIRLIEEIRLRVAAARRRMMLAEVALGVVLTLGVGALLIVLGGAVEASLWLGSGSRWVFVALFTLIISGVAAFTIVLPLLRGSGIVGGWDDAAITRLVGGRYPEVADRLSNLLDLADGRSSRSSAPLIDGAVQMLGRQVAPVPFERIENLDPLRRVAPVAAMPVIGVIAALLLMPGFGNALERLFTPGADFQSPAPFTLIIEPGDVELVRGGELDLTVRAEGLSSPRVVTLQMGREGEDRIEEIRLLTDEDGAFRHTESNVRTGLRYRAEAEGVLSPWYRARVVHRPAIQEMRIVLQAPRYTGLSPQRLAPGVGDITALPGTTVQIVVATDGADVDSAAVIFDSGARTDLEVRGREAAGRFAVRESDTYRVRLRSPDGHENVDAISYNIRTLTDSPPQIRLLEPGDGNLTESLVTRVAARVTDDFGFSRATLFYRLSEREGQPIESEFSELDLPIRSDVLDQDISREWLLGTTGLDLRPGSAVAYYVQVWDNNSVAGYQSARTATHFLRFPSVREQFDQLDEAEDSARQGLDRLQDEADDARQTFEELRNELLRKQDADWEDRRQLERLMQQQQGLEENVRQSVDEMQEVLDRMRENDLVSEETARMYEELRRVIEEIADPELMEQLRQLQEAMEQMDFEQMLQSMENFDFDEQSFRDRLERALELFERLRTAKELDEAARRAEDIAQQEERLSEETGDLQESSESGEMSPEEQQAEQDRLAEQQQQAQEAAEALREQLEQLQERLSEQRGGEQMSQDMQEIMDQLQEAMEQMQENSQQLQDGQLQDAQDGQQQLQQTMEQMQQQLQMMGQQMAGQQQQRNVSGVRRVLDDVLTLSFEQENLRDRSTEQRPDSPVLRQSAQQQVELASGLSTVTDSLRALSREIPEMERAVQERAGEALRLMGDATESLADRQPPRAAANQKGAMTSLNDLAVLLAELLDQMASGASGGSGQMSLQQMLEQLQQMGGDQQQLNEQIQQMLNDMQGQRLSLDQQGRLQQLREQQDAIRQQLEELMREGNLDSQGRSELQRIVEEMEEVSRRMEGGRLDRELREQQQRILTRLLEAHDSINDRGQREEREGTPADQRQRDLDVPTEMPEREEIDRLRRDLIRALESGYAPDYQELIKRYFELLQQRQEAQ